FSFFFQAEDGIRDRNVTGVQTCALPIFQPLDFDMYYLYIQIIYSSFPPSIYTLNITYLVRFCIRFCLLIILLAARVNRSITAIPKPSSLNDSIMITS